MMNTICSAGLQTGVPSKPAFGLLGWETGVPSKPAFGLLGWETGCRAGLQTRTLLPAVLPLKGTSP
jgi:hypothetical protein